jgi:hypothetical protein
LSRHPASQFVEIHPLRQSAQREITQRARHGVDGYCECRPDAFVTAVFVFMIDRGASLRVFNTEPARPNAWVDYRVSNG